ncbi:MAG: hypothetical protein LBG06_03470 [Deltaproteobacteria bacterium]|jgi:hypothetical protein|nr:hypothetical protein [Deltaproteobacteria bacterium]
MKATPAQDSRPLRRRCRPSLPAAAASLALLVLAAACPAPDGEAPLASGWERLYGGSADDAVYSVAAAADGGFAMAGYTASSGGFVPGERVGEDAWMLKVSPAGDPEWQTVLGGDGRDIALSVAPTADGGFVAAGVAWPEDGGPAPPQGQGGAAPDARSRGGPRRGFVARLDSSGAVAWTRFYGGTGFYELATAAEAGDGGFIASGSLLSRDRLCADGAADAGGPRPVSFDLWILRLDRGGGILWERCLGGPANEVPIGALETPGGGVAAAASVWVREGADPAAASGGAWAAALDPGGGELWRRSYGGAAGAARAFSFRAVPEGGYVMTGVSGPWAPADPSARRNALLRLDPEGRVAWSRRIAGRARLADALPLPGGGYLAALLPYPPAPGERPDDGSLELARLDREGRELWREGYGEITGRPAAAFAVLSGGGFAAAGTAARPTPTGEAADRDAWALRLRR